MNTIAKKIVVIIAISLLLLTLLFSWNHKDDDIFSFMYKVLPEAQFFQEIASSPLTYEGKIKDQEGTEVKVGYVVIEKASAYGGPIKMVTGITLDGKIVDTVIADHKDTPSFITKITEKKYLKKFIGKDIADPISINSDIDSISGATYSSRGIAKAISLGSHSVARGQFGLDVHDEVEPFTFAAKELSVILLVVLMLVGVIYKLKKLRWVTLIGSLVLIGFVYNTPISLANIASLLMGNFPSLHENLVWYVLLIGIGLITLILGRNLYCFWLCPFGALQEITAKIGGGKFKFSNKTIESWAPKIRFVLIYLGLLGAFLTKSPSFAGYEPFATFFGRQGFGIEWIILPFVFFASFFISRFWCRFFCPGMVINNLIILFKRFTMRLRKRVSK